MVKSTSDTRKNKAAGPSLFDRWRQAADALPGARFLRHQAEAVEARALRLLRQKLDQVAEPGNRAQAAPAKARQHSQQSHSDATPTQRLQQLMERSLNLDPEQAEEAFYQRLLEQLVPDEARILAALSDGGHITICHVDATSRLGTHSQRLLSNMSRVGQETGVILTDNVPYYIGHLLDLGLLQMGPEDKTKGTQYEMIETNSQVRKLCDQIEKEMHMKPRMSRHTARLSALGAHLWQTCQPGT